MRVVGKWSREVEGASRMVRRSGKERRGRKR